MDLQLILCIVVTEASFNNVRTCVPRGNDLLFIGQREPWSGQLRLPAGIAVEENDRISVADQLNCCIEIFPYEYAPASERKP